MKEILITSSTLILALLAIRFLFRKAVSRRVLYALWALVLIRLLVPVSLPAMSLSVLNAGTEAQAAMTESMGVYIMPTEQTPAADYTASEQVQPVEIITNAESTSKPIRSDDGQTVANNSRCSTVGDVLTYAWMTGIAVMACFFLMTNLRFWTKLRSYLRAAY